MDAGKKSSRFDKANHLFHGNFFAMHTIFDLVIVNTEETLAQQAFNKIYDETLRLNKMLDRFDETSEVSRINKYAATKPLPIDNELFDIITECKTLNQQTQQFFDISIHSTRLQPPGMHGVITNKHAGTIKFANEHIKLDFGGYAKGYALDRANKILDFSGIENALISFGNSSILAKGHHPHGNCWRVSLPSQKTNAKIPVIDLFNECLTTSGNTHTEKAHIISPVSGLLQNSLITISVVSQNATTGEAVSTALVAEGLHEQKNEILNKSNIKKSFAAYFNYGGEIEKIEDLIS